VYLDRFSSQKQEWKSTTDKQSINPIFQNSVDKSIGTVVGHLKSQQNFILAKNKVTKLIFLFLFTLSYIHKDLSANAFNSEKIK